ncbi:MAG: U32 family peptidase C-terminal domain-containing protein [Alphaproteobacteria bacterium]|nr:U32 family peptidase C-terminal domain-containing protein [Alphaproteobacteria bacterium]
MTDYSKSKRTELLLPAGSLLKLKTAILYGADAVYAGTPDMSLRTQSNFTLEDLVEGVRFVHEHGKKIYLTLNLYTHNKDIERLTLFLETIRKVKPDGLIIADPGVFMYVKENMPELECHISTQANVCSWLTVDYWKKMGASLCVLAREVPYKELKEIREKCPDIKLEAFVHGAMCMTYSGRCLLSNFLAERGANQGNCAHSCRWNFKVRMTLKDGSETTLDISEKNKELFDFFLEEDFRQGDFLKIEEDGRGSYILNSRDLCLMPKLDDLLKIGVDSLKIEGRNKSEYYAAITARAYRNAIDAWYENPETWNPEPYLEEVQTTQNRGFTLGFHNGRLTNLAQSYNTTKTVGEWLFAGAVREWQGDTMIFEIRNTIKKGDVIEFLSPSTLEPIRLRLYEFVDNRNGNVKEKVNPGQGFAIRIAASQFNNIEKKTLKKLLPPLSIARKEAELSEARQAVFDRHIQSMQAERGLISENEITVPEPTRTEIRGKDTIKPPKEDSCCGKGCNGCVIFWNDPKYEKAREEMKSKKIGEKLDSKLEK